jgi:hypothetical protein
MTMRIRLTGTTAPMLERCAASALAGLFAGVLYAGTAIAQTAAPAPAPAGAAASQSPDWLRGRWTPDPIICPFEIGADYLDDRGRRVPVAFTAAGEQVVMTVAGVPAPNNTASVTRRADGGITITGPREGNGATRSDNLQRCGTPIPAASQSPEWLRGRWSASTDPMFCGVEFGADYTARLHGDQTDAKTQTTFEAAGDVVVVTAVAVLVSGDDPRLHGPGAVIVLRRDGDRVRLIGSDQRGTAGQLPNEVFERCPAH